MRTALLPGLSVTPPPGVQGRVLRSLEVAHIARQHGQPMFQVCCGNQSISAVMAD